MSEENVEIVREAVMPSTHETRTAYSA